MNQISLSISARGKPSDDPACLWSLLRDLRKARETFGLKPGHLQTLQALISFVRPGGSLTVSASNRTICDRASGINERTLRRHLATLVDAGLIERANSANGKRFRRTCPDSGEQLTWGIDLRPLQRLAGPINDAATQIEIEQRRCRFLRAKLLGLIAKLEKGFERSYDEIRKTLRRRLHSDDYMAMIKKLEPVDNHMPEDQRRPQDLVDQPSITDISPARSGQNVRHHHMSKEDEYDSEDHLRKKALKTEQTIGFEALLKGCGQAISFALKRPEKWLDIIELAGFLAPMIGIGRRDMQAAIARHGAQIASATILMIIEAGPRIHKPAAYFRSVGFGRKSDSFRPSSLMRVIQE